MRNRVRALRVQVEVLRSENNHSQAYMLEREADKLEKEILTSDISFYMEQYTQAMETGNKSDVVNIGRLLRKKQLKLEEII